MTTSSSTSSVAPSIPGSIDPNETAVLPSGRSFDPSRTRWDGILDSEELAYCRANDLPLGYDTAQIGWVLIEPGTVDTGGRPVLEHATTGVTFRPWSHDDVAAHRALLDDRAVWEHLPEQYPEPFTDDTSGDLIALANADIGHEVVAVEVDGELVGQCMVRFDAVSAPPFSAEVAYWLGRAHWGRGAMSRILPEFVERCFEQHPVEEVYAWIRPDNIASIRVAERSGLRRSDVANETELAASQGRPGFLRWSLHRPA